MSFSRSSENSGSSFLGKICERPHPKGWGFPTGKPFHFSFNGRNPRPRLKKRGFLGLINNSFFKKKSFSGFLNERAFVFSVDALIALVLFTGFLQVAYFNPQEKNNFLREIALKNAVSDSLAALDNSGFAVEKLDSVGLASAGDEIYDKLKSLLPANADINVRISSFSANPSQSCRSSESVSDCFYSALNSYSKSSPAPSSAVSVVRDKAVYVSRKGPQSCDLVNSANFGSYEVSSKNNFKKKNAFFSEVFFASMGNVSINFGTRVSDDNNAPISSASCDQNIRVDLNAWLPVDTNTYGRNSANVMLVFDRSGSMSWDGSMTMTNPLDVFFADDFVFTADGSAGLKNFDAAEPVSPYLCPSCIFNSAGTASGVFVFGDTAYLADGSSGLAVVDVANKSAPVLLGGISDIGSAKRVAVSGDTAFVVTSTDGLTNLPDLNFGLISSVSQNIGKSVSESTVSQSFVAPSNIINSVSIYIRKDGSPGRDLSVSLRSSINGPDLAGGSISRNSIGSSFAWFEVDFGSVSVTAGQTYYIFLSTSRTSSSNYYVWAGDNTNPYSGGTAFSQSTSLPLVDMLASVSFSKTVPSGLQLIDVSSSSNPLYLSSIEGVNPQDVKVLGDYAFFADGTAGLKVINFSNLLAPVLTGSIDTTNAMGLSVFGDYVFVADGTSGLRVIDVSNKSAPFIAGTYNTPNIAYDAFYYLDGNVYVADSKALIGINVSNPSSPSLAVSYATPYDYRRVFVANNWAFIADSVNRRINTFNIYVGPKLNQLKSSANNLIDYSGWKEAYDQMGLVSFSGTISNPIDQTLVYLSDTNKSVLRQKVDAMTAGASTSVYDAICAGTRELISSRSLPSAIKFMVVLTDGVSNADTNSFCYRNYGAAYDANSHNIKIYTIAFGGDANSEMMGVIAQITGGKDYSAGDLNALSEVFNLIAIDIGESLSGYGSFSVVDSNLIVPLSVEVNDCNNFLDTGGGLCENISGQNRLDYNIGRLDKNTVWNDYFVLNIPCAGANACDINILTLPFSGTAFSWTDNNGASNSLFWDSDENIIFNYRELDFSLTNPFSTGLGEVSFDLKVDNLSSLDAPNVSVGLYSGAVPNGLISSIPSGVNSGESKIFLDQAVGVSDFYVGLYAGSGSKNWCPVKTVHVQCDGSAQTVYYVIDVSVWLK